MPEREIGNRNRIHCQGITVSAGDTDGFDGPIKERSAVDSVEMNAFAEICVFFYDLVVKLSVSK